MRAHLSNNQARQLNDISPRAVSLGLFESLAQESARVRERKLRAACQGRAGRRGSRHVEHGERHLALSHDDATCAGIREMFNRTIVMSTGEDQELWIERPRFCNITIDLFACEKAELGKVM